MFAKVVLLVSALFGFASSQVTDCGAGKSVFQINSQDFVPNPPVVGENATLWIDYTVPDGVQVDAGTAKYSVTLNGIPFPATKEDLCTQIACPQVPGTYNITSTDVWDGGISGKIISKIEWFDPNGNSLLCSQTTMRVGFRPNLRHNTSGLEMVPSGFFDTPNFDLVNGTCFGSTSSNRSDLSSA